MKYLIITITAISIWLCETNPSIDDFNFYVREQASSQMNFVVAELLSAVAIEVTSRRDYLVASKFTIDTSALRLYAPDMPIKIEVLGIAGQFIPLSDLN